MKKILLVVVRVILAIVFIFSGFVKSADLTGTSIKIAEYFTSFNLESLSLLSPFVAILLSGFELLLGLMLLFNLFKRTTYLLTLISTIGFTILTLYILLFNPVSDCGCFGDALKLTNGETFAKNIVLLLLALSLYLYGRQTYTKRNTLLEKLFLIILALYSFSIGTYSLIRLTPLDFLPYQIGVNILQAMEIPSDAPKDEFELTLRYKNLSTGEITEFKESDTTWYDTSKWEYVDHSSKLLSKGFKPSIESFSIKDDARNEVSGKILNSERQLLILVQNFRGLDNAVIERIERLIDSTDPNLYTPLIITASSIDVAQKYMDRPTPIYNMGQKDLQSILRYPYGAILLDKGTILGKWDLAEDLNRLSQEKMEEELQGQKDRKGEYMTIVLSVFLVISFAYILLHQRIKNRS